MKKTSKILVFICILLTYSSASIEAGESFNFKIETTEENQEFAFWIDNAQDFEVDWGEEAGDNFVPVNDGSSLLSHEYGSPDKYIIKVKGSANRISFFGEEINPWTWTGTPELLIDILTPLSNGVEGITSAEEMFREAENIDTFTAENFFDDISGNVTDMSKMFMKAISFNHDISNWDVSNVTTTFRMFSSAKSFNRPLKDWEVFNVTEMGLMFQYAESFNQDISGWDVSNVESMASMFRHCEDFDQDIGSWDTGNVQTMRYMFMKAVSFNQDIGGWDVSKVEDMKYMFYKANSFNQDLNSWDVSSVTNMWSMFERTDDFNGDIGEWDVSSVEDMRYMFNRASSFNRDISDWDVGNVTIMKSMFNYVPFDQDIGEWDVSSVTDMSEMFSGWDSSFNQDISDWDVDNVTDMGSMFYENRQFNQDIGEWNVSSVKNMSSMFERAHRFNQNIGDWKVENVENMESMFKLARDFNQDISEWDVSNVTNMRSMFEETYAFNQDIGGWDVSNVESMESMFEANTWSNLEMTFDQDISDWDVSNVENFENFLADSKLSTKNYDRLLIGWSDLELNYDITFDAGDSKHSLGLPQDKKEYIENEFDWEINDGGDTGEYRASTLFTINTPGEFSFKVYGAQYFVIDWGEGDGFEDSYSGDKLLSNTYDSSGEYTVQIVGYVERISFYGDGDGTPERLLDFSTPVSEGIYGIKSSSEMFRGAENITSFTAENFFDDISGNVTDMSKMFKGASSFNQDIGSWNTSNVIYMSEMFKEAANFDQDISGWNVENVRRFDDFLIDSGFSGENYNNLLIGWSQQELVPNTAFNAGNAKYKRGLPEERRKHIIDKFNWRITDGGTSWFAYPGYGYSRGFYDEEERLIAKISVSGSAYAFSTKAQAVELSEEQKDAVVNADENLPPEASRTELPLMDYSIIDTVGQDAGSAEKKGDISIRLYAPENLDPIEFQNSKITMLCEEDQKWLQFEPHELNTKERWIEYETDTLSIYTLISYPYETLDKVNVYPNPFKPGDSIYGDVEGGGIRIAGLPADANIRIFNIAGELVDEFKNEGDYSHRWDKATEVASGVYVLVVNHEGETKTRKFSVIR